MPSTGDPSEKEVNFMENRLEDSGGLGWMPTGQAMTQCRFIALSSPSLYLGGEHDDGCLVRLLRG